MPEYIAIAGNIGSGKSSLTTLLAQKFGWTPYYEIVETNPYLADFYKDMKRWSFHLQMFFLTKRFKNQQEIIKSETSVIQDRTIFEDAEIFAKNLYLHGKMEERDYRTYASHYQLMATFLKTPDLLVYLQSDVNTLLERIALRGRDCEKSIPAEYLEQLNQQYESWTSNYHRGPMLTIDVSKMDFVNNTKDLSKIVSLVGWELECLRNKSQKALPLTKAAPQGSKGKKRPAARTPSELSASI